MNPNLPVLCRYLLALVITAAVVLLVATEHNEHWVTTDLKDLSPDLAKSDDVNQVIDTLSSHIEGQFLLLLTGPNEDALLKAEAQVRDSIAGQSELIRLVNSEQLLEELLTLLKQQRFNLLTDAQRSLLASSDDQQILAAAKQSLYRSMGTRLLPVTSDPFNFFTDYVERLLADNPLNSGGAEADDGQWFSTIVVNVVGPALKMDKQASIASAIDQLEHNLLVQDDLHKVKLYRSGIIFFAAEAASNTQKDIKLITTVSIICVVLLLVIIFRSVLPLMLASLSIAVGVVVAFLLSVTLFGSVHIITLLFGASLIGVVVDYALHYFYHYSAGQDNRALYRAMALSLLTSVIGYSALAFSDLLSLQRVAVFSAIGLITAWLAVVALGPVFLSRPLVVNNGIMDKCLWLLDQLVAKCIKPFVWVLMPLIVAGFLSVWLVGIEHNDEPRLFFSPSETLLEEEKVVANLANDYEPGRYVIVKGRSVDEVYQHLNLLKLISQKLYGIDDWLPSPKQQRSAYQLNSRLYSGGGLAQPFYQLIGAKDNLANDLQSQYLAANKIITPDQLMALGNKALPPFWFSIDDHFYSLVRIPKGFNIEPLNALANSNIIVIDSVSMASAALAEQRSSAATLLLAAFVLIALLLLIIYRKLSALLLVMVPAFSTMLTLIIFTLINQPITLFHYMALFLVLGLGMDYMIFAKDMASNNIIRRLTLQAIVLSAITSLLSFGLLGVSSLAVVAGFGLTLFVGNLANLLMTITYSQYYLKSSYRELT